MTALKFLIPVLLLLSACNGVPPPEALAEQPAAQDTVSIHHQLTEDAFLGDIRSAAKTSIVNAIPDTFVTVKALHKWLPKDEYMHDHTEACHNTTPRTPEESHNVCIRDLYLLGVKREDDNDFHLLLASWPSLKKDQPYFSAEISGLPDSSAAGFRTLTNVRDEFLAYFGDRAEHEIVFVASENHPAIHLQYITGSLFFDNHHYSSHSAVKGLKVCSAWEIHPVTAIKFD